MKTPFVGSLIAIGALSLVTPRMPAQVPETATFYLVMGNDTLIVERMTPGSARPAIGRLGPSHDVCAPDCCLPGTGRPSPWDAAD